MTETVLIGTPRCCPTCGDPSIVLDTEVVSTPEGVTFIWWHCGLCHGWHIDVSALTRANGHFVVNTEQDH